MPADSELIQLFESLNETAISQTQSIYGGFCYSIAYRILESEQDAEECVNDAMLHLWNAIPPAKPKSFRAFVITLTRRLVLDRKEHRQAAKRGGANPDTSLEALPDVLPAADDTALAVEQRLLKEALGRFLGDLPKETRIIFLEHYWMMRSTREIAEEHEMGVSAVKMTLLRTRKKLEAFLREEDLL